MGMSDVSDEKLVEVVRSHDQERYRELVERYQDKLLRYVTHITKDHDKAVDVVQDTFIKAFANLHGFNVNRKFSSWIYRIAHNEAVNAVTSRKWQISLDAHEWIPNTISSGENLESQLEEQELAEELRELIDDLPLKYREPLVLFFFEGLQYEEISDVLRLPTSTVGTRIRRAKKLLKEQALKESI